MVRYRLWLLVLGLACAAIPSQSNAAPNPLPNPAEPGVTALPPEVLAAWIDREIEAVWAARKVQPAPVTDDAEFLRRVTLDLIGRIPTTAEVHAFLEDKSSDKRRKTVERLLQSPAHANHFTVVWRSMMLPQNNNQQVQFLAGQLDSWLRKRFRENTPYDQTVRELLTAPIATAQRGGVRPAVVNPTEPTPLAFYQANELKAENLAAATSRLFLGVKLECAQCHDHPFAKWKRTQFWEYAAFFAGVRPQQAQAGIFSPAQDNVDTREITIPGTEKVVKAKFLDGSEPKWRDNTLARETLAEWLTSAENPFFAEAAVNKVWAHFFGIGLIDPIDEPGDENPPSHPQLLKGLARQFALNKFDLRYLVRAVTLSRSYQLTSALTDSSQEDPRVFARMALKGMSAEQLFDSVAAATGYVDATPTNQRGFVGGGSPRADFLVKFSNHADRKTEYQTSILQALSLMNGKFIADATSVEKSQTLGAVADAPFMTNADRVEALFLASLGRKPRPEEADRFGSYIARGGPNGDSKAALADVFWVLLNSSEFLFNH